jgi:eukaryotic-like serine/threonine-protein kinase
MQTIGPYSVIHPIGSGGMAEVFLARARGAQGTEKQLVIKKIHPVLANDPRFVEMFVDEARVAIRLNHTNIVQVYSFEQFEDAFVLAMEYVDGADLRNLVRSASREERAMPHGFAAYVAQEVAKGLDYAHSRRDDRGVPLDIVHRDISPHNVLISRDGAVKIADFGIARARWLQRDADGAVEGKVAYMAPEQAEGRLVDRRADIYSLGAVLHELLVGRPLVPDLPGEDRLALVRAGRHPTPRQVDEDVPAELDAVVRRAVSLRPEDRFSSAREMARSLRAYLHSQPEIYDAQTFEEWIGELLPAALEPDTDEPREASPDLGATARRRPAARFGETVEEERRAVVAVTAKIDPRARAARDGAGRELRRLVGELAYKVNGVHRGWSGGHRIFLGLPRSTPEDAMRALRAAHDLIDLVRAFGRDRGGEIEARVAVNRGAARCRTAGPDRQQGLELDPEPELLEQSELLLERAAPGEVIAGGGVYRLARRDYNFDGPLGSADGEPHRTSGAAGIKGYRVRSAKSRSERAEQSDERGSFFGRRDELRQLRRAYRQARDGRVALMRVSGEKGIGKTRLAVRLLEELPEDRIGLVRVDALFAERESPLTAAAAAVRAVLHQREEGGAPRELTDGLAPLLDSAPSYLERQLRFFAGILADPVRAWAAAAGRQRLLVRRMAYGLGVLLARAAGDRTLVLLLDNAHWVDGQSAEVFAELADHAERAPVLVLLVGEPIAFGARGLRRVRELRLGELGDEEMRALIAERIGERSELGPVTERIAARAQGNPFFAAEIIDSLIEREILVPDEQGEGRRYRQARSGAIRLPTTMEGIALEQVDALAPGPRAALRAASAVGTGFSARTVSELIGRDATGEVELLERRGLLIRMRGPGGDETEYRFRRPMVREAAYSGLSPDDRRRIHDELARELEQRSARGEAVPQARIAWHLERAGREREAAQRYLEAGGAARRIHSNREALRLYDRGLSLLSGDAPERFAALRDREKVLRDLGRLAERESDIGELAAYAERGGSDAQRAEVSNLRARLAYDRGEFVEAAAHLNRALEIGAGEAEPATRVESLRLLAYVAAERGHLVRALDCCKRALALVPAGEEQGAYLRGRVLNAQGLVLSMLGQIDRAPAVLAEALVLFRRLGKRRNESTAISNAALVAGARGELVEAIRMLESAIRIDRQVGDVSARGRKLAAVGAFRAEIGDFAAARADLEEARAICRENGEPVGQAEAEQGLAELWLWEGDALRAREVLGDEDYREFVRSSRILLARHHQLESAAALAAGEARRAAAAAAEATRIAFEAGMNGEAIHGRALLGLALAERGRCGEALVAARRAVDLLSDLGGVRRAEEVYWRAALSMHRCGEARRAERCHALAEREVERKLELIRDRQARRRYDAHPLVRSILAGLE